MIKKAEVANSSYNEEKDVARVTDEPEMKDAAREYIFAAGKSAVLWLGDLLWRIIRFGGSALMGVGQVGHILFTL